MDSLGKERDLQLSRRRFVVATAATTVVGFPAILRAQAAPVKIGIMHPITPTYAVLATGVGVYLGVIFLLNENLLVVMLAHGLYDFIALLYLTRS